MPSDLSQVEFCFDKAEHAGQFHNWCLPQLSDIFKFSESTPGQLFVYPMLK